MSLDDARKLEAVRLALQRGDIAEASQIRPRVRADAGGGEVSKTADWIIDLGPEGGDGGGEIVAAGTPEDVVREKRSYTGAFLKPVLNRQEKPKKRIQAAE